jgi:hypothetical protein
MTTFLTRYIDFVVNYIQLFFRFAALSLYSPEFYQDVYKRFNGWGVRYVFTASFIATLVVSIFYLKIFEQVRDYYAYDKTSESLSDLDHIMNQFPSLNYNGKSISIDEEEPYYIYNLQGKSFLVIDTYINNNDKYKTERVVLTKDHVIFNFAHEKSKPTNSVYNIEYNKILSFSGLNNASQILTLVEIKRILAHVLENTLKVFTYIIFPILLIINLLYILLLKIMNIVIIYIFLNMFVGKALIKDAFRLVMFASAVPIILSQLPTAVPLLTGVAPMVELWSLMIMVYGLYRLKDQG